MINDFISIHVCRMPVGRPVRRRRKGAPPQVAMPSGGLHCLPRIYHNDKISIHAPIRERLSLPEGNLS